MIDLGLTGKRVLVAGAGYQPERGGIGHRTVRALSDAGAHIICVDKDAGRAEVEANDVIARGGSAAWVVGDMTDPRDTERAVEEATDVWAGLDGCVDIVGGARWGGLLETTDAEWDWVRANNINQVFYLYRAAARRLIEQRDSFLIAIASVDGTISSPYHAAYGAAKAGIISMTKTYAEELGPHGVRVNAVAPGSVGFGDLDKNDEPYGVDGLHPLAPPASLDIANAVLFLASSLARRITGQTIIVDGGASVASPWRSNATEASQRKGPGEALT